MGSRVAQGAFAAFYLIIAIVSVWGGFNALNPPLPAPTPQNPDPLPLLVNSGMVLEAAFYFLTGAAFLAVTAYGARGARSPKAGGVAAGLNIAFAAALIMIGAYLLWFGAQLLMLGGSFYYALAGLALIGSAVLLIMRRPLGVMIYSGIVAVTVIWSVMEAGLDFVAVLPRVAAWIVVGLWFLSPWHRTAMGKTAETRIDTGGRWVGFASLVGVLLLAVSAMQGYSVVEGTKNDVAAGTPVTDWRSYGGVPEGHRFAQLDQINLENVGQLKEVWRARTGVAYDFKQTPQMANGLVYICTAGNTLLALDSDTGETRWAYDTKTQVPGGLDRASTFARSCRGLGYHEAQADYTGECAKRIITGTVDARLIAVDAMTGQLCRSFGFDGQVNLVSGLGRSPLGNFMVTSTPLIAGDKVVVGGWVTDNQQLGNPSGVLRAYSAVTGEFVWAWDLGNPGYHGLPDEGGEYTRGTPNVWSHTSYDAQLNLIFAPTGNSSPDYFDGTLRTKEAEENASSIVAIDANTGERRWVYQTVHRDIWDWDVPSQPVLVNIRKNGQGDLIPAVAQPTKRGEIFLLDRRTGAPIYDTPERDVPQNPAEGERVTATQPFSTLPHFRDDRLEQDMWGLTPLDQLHCRIEYKKMRYEGLFTPPMEGGGGYGMAEESWGGTFQYPGNYGGFNWGSVAVDPDSGLLIGAPMLMGNRIVLRSLDARAADAERDAKRRAERGANGAAPAAAPAASGGGAAPRSDDAARGGSAQVFDQNRVLYRGDTRPFMSAWRLPLPFLNLATELPCFEPPFAQIGAMDLNTGKLLWKRPVGSMKESGPFGIPTGLPFMVGTPVQAALIATRGGLVFHGGAMDSTIRAFDMRTGEVRWEAPLPGSAHATPISYLGNNGKQYVVINVPNPSWRYPANNAMKPSDDEGGYVVAFALPDAPAR